MRFIILTQLPHREISTLKRFFQKKNHCLLDKDIYFFSFFCFPPRLSDGSQNLNCKLFAYVKSVKFVSCTNVNDSRLLHLHKEIFKLYHLRMLPVLMSFFYWCHLHGVGIKKKCVFGVTNHLWCPTYRSR